MNPTSTAIAPPVIHLAPPPLTTAGVSSPMIDLSGEWTALSPAPATPPPEPAGRRVLVPGQWFQQGVIKERSETVMVFREFDVPMDWKSAARFLLEFESVHGDCVYWLNGKRIGHSTRLATPVQLEVAEALLVGQRNLLAVAMKLESRAEKISYMSAYAKHPLLGLPRAVRLFALPELSLSSLHLGSDLHGEGGAGVSLSFALNAVPGPDDEVVMRLDAPEGGPSACLSAAIRDLRSGQDGRFHSRITVPDARLWTAETPWLYHFTLELRRAGAAVATYRERVGLREIRIKGGKFLVNGQPIKLRGVNRHEVAPLTGRADTAKWARTDAELFKAANVNYIRTAHYPPTREFLDACDEIGLYVQCEAPFCWTSVDKTEEDEANFPAFLEASAAMVEAHRNRPSIILWSLSNESNPNPRQGGFIGLLPIYRQLAEWYPTVDPSRATTINNVWNNNGGLTDVGNVHYPDHPDTRFENYQHLAGDTRPALIDEHMHNHCYNREELRADPGLSEQWVQMRTSFGPQFPCDPLSSESVVNQIEISERMLGGAIWAGIDEVFVLPDGEVGWGAWGTIDGWRRKKPEWFHTHMMYSPVWIGQRVAPIQDGAAVVQVESRFHHTCFSSLRLRWSCSGASGELRLPDTPPRGVCEVRIPMEPMPSPGSVLELEFLARDGRSVVRWGVHLDRLPEASPRFLPETGCPSIVEEEAGWTIMVADRPIHINRADGQWTGGPFRGSPVPHFTQREKKGFFNDNAPSYLALPAPGGRVLDVVRVSAGHRAAVISQCVHSQEFIWASTAELDSAGVLRIEVTTRYDGEPREIREAGIRIPLVAGFERISWTRRADWCVYPEGHIGRPRGSAEAVDLQTADLPMSDTYQTPRVLAETPWERDPSPMGIRDFRATKWNFDTVELQGAGRSVEFRGGMAKHLRACLVPGEGVDVFVNEVNPPGMFQRNDIFRAEACFRLL